jgi:putative flippase GtrA
MTSTDDAPKASGLPALIRRLWSSEVLRFLSVGALNTAVGYGLYVGQLWLGMPYQAALTIATVLGATFNFFSTGRLVFGNRSLARIGHFLAVYSVALLVNLGLLTLLVRGGMSKALAQGLLLPVMVTLSFLLNKYLVFGTPP